MYASVYIQFWRYFIIFFIYFWLKYVLKGFWASVQSFWENMLNGFSFLDFESNWHNSSQSLSKRPGSNRVKQCLQVNMEKSFWFVRIWWYRSSPLEVFSGKVFWKYAAHLRENTHTEVWFKYSCFAILSESHFGIDTGCWWRCCSHY